MMKFLFIKTPSNKMLSVYLAIIINNQVRKKTFKSTFKQAASYPFYKQKCLYN